MLLLSLHHRYMNFIFLRNLFSLLIIFRQCLIISDSFILLLLVLSCSFLFHFSNRFWLLINLYVSLLFFLLMIHLLRHVDNIIIGFHLTFSIIFDDIVALITLQFLVITRCDVLNFGILLRFVYLILLTRLAYWLS